MHLKFEQPFDLFRVAFCSFNFGYKAFSMINARSFSQKMRIVYVQHIDCQSKQHFFRNRQTYFYEWLVTTRQVWRQLKTQQNPGGKSNASITIIIIITRLLLRLQSHMRQIPTEGIGRLRRE